MNFHQATAEKGFTLTDLMLTLIAVASMVLVLLQAARPRGCVAARISCTNNLKQVGLAYRQWAIDNGDRFPMAVSVTNGGAMEAVASGNLTLVYQVMSNELNTPKILFCPQETNPKRVTATTFVPFVPAGQFGTPFAGNTNVSYFVGLDADETQPNTILSGDDNFLVNGVQPKSGVLSLWTNSAVAWTKDRHVKQGNVGLADGSVMGVSTPRLAEVLVKTGAATNRLAMP